MKKKITAIVAAAVVAVMALASCGTSNPNQTGSNQTTPEKVTPTFMYFVSDSDENLDAAKATVEELEAEYDGKVNFNVINVTENPDALTNFPLVDGNTPMLIMLNTSNDISAMSPKTTDKSELEKIINEALK